MNIDWFTFGAQILNFLILLFLLRKFLYKPLLGIMDQREQLIRDRKKEADEAFEKASEKAAYHDKQVQEFESKVDQMKKEALEEVGQFRKELMAEARSEVDEIKKEWEHSFEEQKDLFLSELYKKTSDSIIDMLGELLNELSHPDLDQVIIGKFISQIRSMSKHEGSKAFHGALESGKGEIEVLSTFDLEDAQMKQIREAVHSALTDNLNIRFGKASALGYGIVLRANGWKLGWSTAGFVDKLKNETEKYLENIFKSKQSYNNALKE